MNQNIEAQQIAASLRSFIGNRFAIPEHDADFSDDIDLLNYGYIDSLGLVELTAFIEREFTIAFRDSDWVNFPLHSICDISSFVAKRLAGLV